MSEIRTKEFQRNPLLETLLTELNNDLNPSEERVSRSYLGQAMPHPLILVMGPLRSGTTLLTQWLASTGLVAYPTNILSRFYQAPIIGAKIQRLLTDPLYNFRDELGEFCQKPSFDSDNGKTKGALSPNEFWYFWRRFLPDPERDVWTNEELHNEIDTVTLCAELTGVMDVFQKPFAMKGMLFNYNIPFLDSIFEKALFIQIKRNPIDNAASILEARKRQFGSTSKWYSFKIPEYEKLKSLDPIQQACGQVYYTNKAIDKDLRSICETRKQIIEYEKFCRNPQATFNELTKKLNLAHAGYVGQKQFQRSRHITKNQEELKKMKIALQLFAENDLDMAGN